MKLSNFFLIFVFSQDCDKILLQKDEDLFSGVLLQDISIETVMELRKTGIAWSKIATLLGISRRTMYNRRQAFEMKEPNDSLSDEELHTAIHRIHETCPTSGRVNLIFEDLSQKFITMQALLFERFIICRGVNCFLPCNQPVMARS